MFLDISAGGAQAATITLTTANGLGADTFLNGGSQIHPTTGIARRDSNFGADDKLVVKFSPRGPTNNDIDFDSQFTRFSLLRFDQSSVIGTVTAATLTLDVKTAESAVTNGPPANVSFTLTTLAAGEVLDAAPAAGAATGCWNETDDANGPGITMANSFLAGLLPLQGPILLWVVPA